MDWKEEIRELGKSMKDKKERAELIIAMVMMYFMVYGFFSFSVDIVKKVVSIVLP